MVHQEVGFGGVCHFVAVWRGNPFAGRGFQPMTYPVVAGLSGLADLIRKDARSGGAGRCNNWLIPGPAGNQAATSRAASLLIFTAFPGYRT
jgi:hypothetical protein